MTHRCVVIFALFNYLKKWFSGHSFLLHVHGNRAGYFPGEERSQISNERYIYIYECRNVFKVTHVSVWCLIFVDSVIFKITNLFKDISSQQEDIKLKTTTCLFHLYLTYNQTNMIEPKFTKVTFFDIPLFLVLIMVNRQVGTYINSQWNIKNPLIYKHDTMSCLFYIRLT